jgi:hypothetical protein
MDFEKESFALSFEMMNSFQLAKTENLLNRWGANC